MSIKNLVDQLFIGLGWQAHRAALGAHRYGSPKRSGNRTGPKASEKTRFAKALLNKIKKMEVGTGFGWNWLECESQGQPQRAMGLILQNEEFKQYVEQVDRPWLWLRRKDKDGVKND